MKKFYVTLMALLIAVASFAQEASFSGMQIEKSNKISVPKAKKTLFNQSKSGSGTYEFYYPHFLSTITGSWEGEIGDLESNLAYAAVPIHCDSTVRFQFSSGIQPVQYYGLGQVFAFNDDFWKDGAEATISYFPTEPAPHISTATTYSVDAVGIEFLYRRGSEVAPSVVDTLVINVLSNLTNLTYAGLSNGECNNSTIIKYAQFAYSLNTLQVTQPSGAHLQVIKVPLRVADTTLPDGSNLFRTYPVENMMNITQKNLLIFYTFKSGVPSNPQNIMGKEISTFAGYFYDDPRSEYMTFTDDQACTATCEQGPVTEKNTSLCVTKSVYNSSWGKDKLHPMNLWCGPLGRPSISAVMTCDDCSWSSIKEMTHKNITIQPNPATSNFTVDLGSAGKSNIEMFNLVGQKVYSTTTNEASLTVNVSDYKSGVYMLKINKNGQIYTSKVVVK